MNKAEKAIEAAIMKQYDSVDEEIVEDLNKAMKWSKKQLKEKEGKGHIFQVFAVEEGMVACSFSKPEWSGEHCSRPMDLASEAVVMAVCEYLNGA